MTCRSLGHGSPHQQDADITDRSETEQRVRPSTGSASSVIKWFSCRWFRCYGSLVLVQLSWVQLSWFSCHWTYNGIPKCLAIFHRPQCCSISFSGSQYGLMSEWCSSSVIRSVHCTRGGPDWMGWRKKLDQGHWCPDWTKSTIAGKRATCNGMKMTWPRLYSPEYELLRKERSSGNSLFFNPSPPGLLGAPLSAWVGGGSRPPLLSREPLVVESRARRHSKALHKTCQNHLSELKIEVKCEVKVRSKVKIWRFDVFGPGDQDYRTWWLKLRKNVAKGMVKVWYEYKWHTKKTSWSRSGHKMSLCVRIVIKPCDTCFMAQFWRRTRKSRLKYRLT